MMRAQELFNMIDLLRDDLGIVRRDSVKSTAQIQETVGDNVVDNMVDELRRAVDIELGQFVMALLNTSIQNFMYAYSVPQFEGFKENMGVVLDRYQLMDGSEQGDLFAKIEIMFKDLFVQKHSSLGPEAAELVAKKYALQMINYLKANAIQANVNLHQNKVGQVY